MIDLKGFKNFTFNDGGPTMSISKTGVTFNKEVLYVLDYPSFVEILINDKKRQMILQTSNDKNPKALAFYKTDAKKHVTYVRWNGRELVLKLADIANLSLDNKELYKVRGVYYSDMKAILFDLNNSSKCI